MAFTLPTLESSPTFDGQTVPDSTDFALLTGSMDGTGVISGCAVTPHTGSDMNVSIAAGIVLIAGLPVIVAAVTSLAVGAASSFDRRDIVVVNSSGTVSVTAGTPCTTAGWSRTSTSLPPVKQAIPANSTVLAEVYVASATTVIATGNIVDKTTLLLSLNNAINRTASATVTAGEDTAFTGSTATQTMTLAATPPNGTANRIFNYSTQNLTVAPGAGATLNTFGTTGNATLTVGESAEYIYVASTTTWYCNDTNNPSYNPVAAPIAKGGTGLTAVGTAGQIPVVNAAATGLDYRSAAPTTIETSLQSLSASADNILTGSVMPFTAGDISIGTCYEWIVQLIKTAAGVATFSMTVRVGTTTTGTITDTAVATFTSGTNTAAIDQSTIRVVARCTSIATGSATFACAAFAQNELTSATGLGIFASPIPGSTATVTVSTAESIHVDVTPGSAAVMTAACFGKRIQ